MAKIDKLRDAISGMIGKGMKSSEKALPVLPKLKLKLKPLSLKSKY